MSVRGKNSHSSDSFCKHCQKENAGYYWYDEIDIAVQKWKMKFKGDI